MALAGTAPSPPRAEPRQWIKWTVYALLLLNWGYYAWDEWHMAQHTLRDGGTWLQWSAAFATTLDEGAWFGLLFLWELETWWLPWDWHRPGLQRLILGIRLVCYVFITHTVIARAVDYRDVLDIQPLAGIGSLCDLSGTGRSFTHNLDYTLIDERNCGRLSSADRFYAIEATAVTDAPGLGHERVRRLVDLSDALTWLLVMFTIELAIWLQERKVTGGPLMLVSFAGKAFYALLFLHAGYWAWNGHWMYAWDQALWIGGFFAIELNVRAWRDELERSRQDTQRAADALG